MEYGTDVGPFIKRVALEKVASHVEDAAKHKGKILCGEKVEENCDEGGNFYDPTVINYAHDQMKISTEETFGPVAPIFTL